MKSRFPIESIVEDMITHNIRTVFKDSCLFEDLVHFDCQDTDKDGNIECYFTLRIQLIRRFLI